MVMMDLQSLMDSWSLEDHSGSRSQQQIEDLADRLRERLEIDLGREQFRDLAAKLIQLNLEKKGQTSSIGSAASNQGAPRPPSSTSTWHSPGQENSVGARGPPTNSLQSLFDPPAATQTTTTRGRQRERQQSLPHARNSAHVRSFFGFGTKPSTATSPIPAATSLKPLQPQQTTRTRSRSPFRLFTRSNHKPSQETTDVGPLEEEKKEHDLFSSAATGPAPNQASTPSLATTNTSAANLNIAGAARTPVRGIPRHHSGRASPTLDPSADKPSQPPRARSPFHGKRAHSPVPNRAPNYTRTVSPKPGPRDTSASPVPSPLAGPRPGLQEDDHASQAGSQSPARRATTTDDLDAKMFTAPSFDIPRHGSHRPNHGAEQEDDESGLQPRRGHRKSLSEPMQLGDLNLNAADWQSLRKDGPNEPASNGAQWNSQSADGAGHPVQETLPATLTPPVRTPKNAPETNAVAEAFQTGAGKNRRKGGTPPFADTEGSRFFNGSNPFGPGVHVASSLSAPTGNGIPSQSAATGSVPAGLGFSMGEPPVGIHHQNKARVPPKRNFRRPSPVIGVPAFQASAPEPSPPSPMDIDPMEATPPPKLNIEINQQTAMPQFNMGLNIPRKQLTPTRSKPRTPPSYSPRSEGQTFASMSMGTVAAAVPSPAAVPRREAPLAAPDIPLAPSKEEKRIELVNMLRNEARKLYVDQNFAGSILQWTKAIKLYDDLDSHEPNDTLAVLLSNRAACFLMIHAFEAAIKDCIQALLHVSESTSVGDPFTHDSGLPLRVKLLVRLGKAYLKNGDHATSIQTLDKAIEHAAKAITLAAAILPPMDAEKSKSMLSQLATEATLTKSEAERLASLCTTIFSCTTGIHSGHTESADRRIYVEALAQVNIALSIACGSVSLFQCKVALLTTMKRWRETASFLERLACSRVPWDAVFHDADLASHHPLPGVPRARFLSATAFANVEENDEVAEVKLNSKSCGEAVLRLPFPLTRAYLRALRLEERYPSAEAALKALEDLVERGHHVYNSSSLESKFSWLSREYIKLNRTKKGREYGDKLFRSHDYDLAAKEYGKCLVIDGEDNGTASSETAGGRLHAVLYCNRAACFMAMQRYTDALDECAAALRIHPRYMKALLRRARCYTRLNRFEEAIREYEKWRDLAAEGQKNPKSSSGGSPCWFDLPREVTASDVETVVKELDEVQILKRKMEAASREAADRRDERRRWQESNQPHSFGAGSHAQSRAQQRQQDWYNQRNDSRRWDSFSGRNPRSGTSASSGTSGHYRSRSWNNGPNMGGSHSAHQRRDIGSPGSDLSISHYAVLGIDINATARDVKKAYRAKALTEHPDKNINDPHAADKFRRIQLAYEILSDTQSRYKYDVEQGYIRR